MQPRVYITQPVAASAIERLKKVAEVTVNPDSSRIPTKQELIKAAQSCDVLFGLLHDPVDRDVLAANPDLRGLASMTITPDNIDVTAATDLGIPVSVVPAIVAEETADIAFGLLLAVGRRLVEADRFVRAGGYPGAQSAHLLGSGVNGKTIGLVGGKGRIGRATAKRAHGFGMRVLYWGPRRMSAEQEAELGMEYAPFDELIAESDFLSLHQPMNAETHHMIDAKVFKAMKPTAFIINTARGPIIDEAALVEALEAGEIAGAGLDVYEHEPTVHPGLLSRDDVVLAPHLGSGDRDKREEMANIVADNVIALLKGEVPPNCINTEVFSS